MKREYAWRAIVSILLCQMAWADRVAVERRPPRKAAATKARRGTATARLVDVGVEAVEVAGDGGELGEGGEAVEAAGVGHFPTEPVDAGGEGQAGGVVGGGGEVDEGSGEGIGFVPPVKISDLRGLVHVGGGGAIDGGAEEEELDFGDVWSAR